MTHKSISLESKIVFILAPKWGPSSAAPSPYWLSKAAAGREWCEPIGDQQLYFLYLQEPLQTSLFLFVLYIRAPLSVLWKNT